MIVFKGTNPDLAKAEFKTLWHLYFDECPELNTLGGCVYYFTSSRTPTSQHVLFTRLTLTNYLGVRLHMAKDLDPLFEGIKEEILLSHYRGSFAVRIRKTRRGINVPHGESELAGRIWDCFHLSKPKVDLTAPGTEFTFLYDESGQIHLLASCFINRKGYLDRMPKQRPVNMPYTLKSDISRAAVNLLHLKEGVIADPFCGIGGIALEILDMGFLFLGSDISRRDLYQLRENVSFFFPETEGQYLVYQSDIRNRTLSGRSLDGMVSDIPYGRASRRTGMESVYEAFLQEARSALKPGARLVVVYADFIPFKHLVRAYFHEIEEIEEYINASMTRYILVLERPKDLNTSKDR
jgi:tRNA (guanine10-N2)-dimethyltransferase